MISKQRALLPIITCSITAFWMGTMTLKIEFLECISRFV